MTFDATGAVVARVREAAERGRGLAIRAGGTRVRWHQAPRTSGIELDMTPHAGILAHEPTELVLTARAGTRLVDVEAALAEHDQQLPFEPPRFGEASTLGGAVASGLSGPARPWLGAVRDAVLGVGLVDGHGEVCRFGGQVMKNVAGYDVSRLQAGAFGTLGVLLDVSLRVRARPETGTTCVLELDVESARRRMLELGRHPWPLTGLAWHEGRLHVRLAGAAEGVEAAAAAVGGERADGDAFWHALRDLALPFFGRGDVGLWRLSLPFDAPEPDFAADWLIDWGGAQRWCCTHADAATVLDQARRLGGHATRLAPTLLRTPPAPAVAALESRVRRALDPAAVLNPGVMDPATGEVTS